MKRTFSYHTFSGIKKVVKADYIEFLPSGDVAFWSDEQHGIGGPNYRRLTLAVRRDTWNDLKEEQ